MNVFENQVVIEGRQAAALSVSGTAASVYITQPGVYAVWSDIDVYIRVAQTAARAETVTTSNGLKVTGSASLLPVRVTRPCYLGGIAGSAGTLYYHQVG